MTEYKFVKVTHDEFRAFLAAYPGGLQHDCVTIADPPIHNYCDWTKTRSPVGTGEAHAEATQAYCVYADERGGEDKFFVRAESTTDDPKP